MYADFIGSEETEKQIRSHSVLLVVMYIPPCPTTIMKRGMPTPATSPARAQKSGTLPPAGIVGFKQLKALRIRLGKLRFSWAGKSPPQAGTTAARSAWTVSGTWVDQYSPAQPRIVQGKSKPLTPALHREALTQVRRPLVHCLPSHGSLKLC